MSSQTTTTNSPWVKNATPSPWGKKEAAKPCSLEDVMSEQLAEELENKDSDELIIHCEVYEVNEFEDECCTVSDVEYAAQLAAEEEQAVQGSSAAADVNADAELAAKLAAEDDGNLSNDELIARYLQRDFDREHNSSVDMIEKSYNGSSKVSISFANYKQREQASNDNEDEDEDDDDFYDHQALEHPSKSPWDSPKPNIGAKGYAGQGKNIVTKHDKTICGRRNAERMMEFPPEFESGDGEGMDMQLPNKVYNSLKKHSIAENKRGHKVHEKKDHSTAIKAVDERTRILMFKMINSGFLSSIDGVINEGKEAVVFKAAGDMKGEKVLPKDVILKVYKTTMNEFKNRAKYVYGDHRLSKDILKKHNPRKIMRLWAEKEFLNLKRMRRHNLPCPEALALKRHILAMTCIGGEHPAPKLKDVKLTAEHMQDAYEQTVDIMKSLYQEAGFVHADLSEFNLLWHDEKVWVIDVSQAREKENASSNGFLLRDCQNVCKFFRDVGVHNVSSPEELFMDITHYSLKGEGKIFEAQVERYAKDEFAFDFYFELAESARLQDLNNDDSASSEESEEEGGAKEGESKLHAGEEEEEIDAEKDAAAGETSDKCPSGKWVIDSS